MAQRLLEPLLANLDTLSLSQCAVGDATAALLARAPRLRRIDLRGTATSDAGVRALCALPHLEELVLARTRITDSAVERLAAMPALRCVFVWSTGVTAKGLAELRTCKPKLYVNAGEFQAAATQESEPPIKLSSDAPEPGKPAAAPAAAVTAAASPAPPPTPAAQPTVTLQPVNTVCPVSGSPVDPKFAVVHKNRVIGFCCPNCPGQFWADPAKFEAKLPPLAALPVAGG